MLRRSLVLLIVAVALFGRDPRSLVPLEAATASGALSAAPLNQDFSNQLSHWTAAGSGQVSWNAAFAFEPADASWGDYSDSNNTCSGGAGAGVTSRPGAKLEGNASVTSDPLTAPADGTHVMFRLRAEALPGATISLLYGAGFAQEEVIYNKQFTPSGIYNVLSVCNLPGFLRGQAVKVKIASSSGGAIYAAFAGKSSSLGNAHFGATAGEPVETGSGAFTHAHADLGIPGRGVPLTFERQYNSIERSAGAGSLGQRWFHNYDMGLLPLSSGSVVVRYPGGSEALFENQAGTLVPPAHVFDTLIKSAGPPVTYTLTTTSQVRFTFDSAGKLLTIADRNDNTTTLTYDASGLDRVTDAAGRYFDFTNSQGRITRIDDPQGARYVEYAYNGSGELTQVRDVGGGITTFTYDNHQLLTIRDARANALPPAEQYDAVLNVYDSAGRVAKQTDAIGDKSCFYYGHGPANPSPGDCPGVTPAPQPGATAFVNGRGHKTTYFFDTSFRTADVVDALSNETHFTYEASGALCSPANNGNLCSVRDPLNHTDSFTYDANGNVLSRTDALSRSWTYTYTLLNDLASERDPLFRTTEYGYNAGGNLTSETRKDENGVPLATTAYARNGLGDLTSLTDANNHTTTYTYDANGHLDLVTDALTHVTDHDFDSAGRLGCVIDGEGKQTAYAYDARNQVRFLRDAENTDFVAGGCALAPGGADSPTEYTYDQKGNRTTVKNARGKTTAYAFDRMDRLSSVTDPLARVTGFTYDANGNLLTRAGPRLGPTNQPRVNTYQYDALDRLTAVLYPDFHLNVSYAYLANGQRQSMTDPMGTTTYQYFADDRLQQLASPQGTVQYAYDAAGNRTGITYPDPAKVVSYTYDAFDRMKTVTDWLGNTTTYSYDGVGNLMLTTYPTSTGMTSTRTYDAADRLDTVTNQRGTTTLSSYDYALDNVGNRTQIVEPAGTSTFGYDDVYRLSAATYPNGDVQSYTYDAIGNRQSKVHNGTPTTYSYDDADQMTAAGGVSYTYEKNGMLSRIGTTDAANVSNHFPLQDYDEHYLRIGHCYDQFINGAFDGFISVGDVQHVNQAFGTSEGSALYGPRKDASPADGPDGAISVADTSRVNAQFGQSCPDTAHYFYNGDGLRVQKWAGAAPNMRRTDYLWDAGGRLPVILQETTAGQTTYYVYGVDLISTVQGSTATYYLNDGLGSTTGLTNSAGSVTDTYAYDAFGAVRSQSGSSSQPFRFTGELEDANVAHQPYYLRARYYDPALGRFWARDPVLGSAGESQSWNAYPYVANNPATLVDPTGLDGDEPTPIPAPRPPWEQKEHCRAEAEECREYARERGIRDGYEMVCIPLEKLCLKSNGDYDRQAYIDRWKTFPKVKDPHKGPRWSLRFPDIRFPKTGTGGYLPRSKEGRGLDCGGMLPFGGRPRFPSTYW